MIGNIKSLKAETIIVNFLEEFIRNYLKKNLKIWHDDGRIEVYLGNEFIHKG